MKLRNLEINDAPLMLEWMKSKNVTSGLSSKFSSGNLIKCEQFIRDSYDTYENLHLAIADDNNIYMGTVSLKHIDRYQRTAEFAVAVRECAMGKGFSSYGMAKILKKGKTDYNLRAVYWCVLKTNIRAIKFYDKNNYKKAEYVPEHILQPYIENLDDYIWYVYE